jgi:hypothetical protein
VVAVLGRNQAPVMVDIVVDSERAYGKLQVQMNVVLAKGEPTLWEFFRRTLGRQA